MGLAPSPSHAPSASRRGGRSGWVLESRLARRTLVSGTRSGLESSLSCDVSLTPSLWLSLTQVSCLTSAVSSGWVVSNFLTQTLSTAQSAPVSAIHNSHLLYRWCCCAVRVASSRPYSYAWLRRHPCGDPCIRCVTMPTTGETRDIRDGASLPRRMIYMYQRTRAPHPSFPGRNCAH